MGRTSIRNQTTQNSGKVRAKEKESAEEKKRQTQSRIIRIAE